MNVTFTGEIFSTQKYGGISRYFVELALALVSSKDVHVRFRAPIYVNEYLHRHRRELQHRGVYFPRSFRGLHELSNTLAGLTSKLSRENSTDIIHETYFSHDLLNRSTGRKTATFYDMIYERFSPSKDLTRSKKLTFEACNHCIAISEATKRDMVEFLNVPPEKITVVYLAANLCEPNETDRLRRTLGPSKQPFVLWVGPRAWYKNFDQFVKAFSISNKNEGKPRIVCAGGPVPKVKEKEGWLKLGLDPAQVVHVQPTDAELAWLYKKAAFLAYLSLYEGFGIPPLEAMSYGCPVLASGTGSIPEVVGNAAVQADPSSLESMSDGIDRILDSSDFRKVLIEKGFRQASKFSWQKCAAETWNVYSLL